MFASSLLLLQAESTLCALVPSIISLSIYQAENVNSTTHCRQIYESMLFLFLEHAYDVGDLLEVEMVAYR